MLAALTAIMERHRTLLCLIGMIFLIYGSCLLCLNRQHENYPNQRPGQRYSIEYSGRKVVLPTAAVRKDAKGSYVLRQNGRIFERVSVEVEFRTPEEVFIENNGSIFEGDVIAGRAAHQLRVALRDGSALKSGTRRKY